MRQVVRRCILSRLIIGDPIADDPLSAVADRALLSHQVLDRAIRQPIEDFEWRVGIEIQNPDATELGPERLWGQPMSMS